MDAVPTANRIETLLAESEWVGALALGLVRDDVAADDLVQDTWLAALRRPPAARASLRPWLATVTRNAARFQRRSEGARKARESSHAQGLAGDTSPAPEELLARLETQELVSRLVRELPADLSEVILLSFFEGLSSDEIARQRGLPAGTVRWRKKRALEVLRERLDARYDGDRSAWLSALVPLATNASQKSAPAAGIGGILAGLLAPWIAMSAPVKVAAVLVLALLAAAPFVKLGDDPTLPHTKGIARPEISRVDPLPNPEKNPELTRVPQVAATTTTQEKDAGESAAPPVTTLRLSVVDAFGAPVPDVTVTASPSLDMERQHEELFSGFDALKLLSLQAQLKQETGTDGVAEWSTDLVRFGGLIDFYAEGPRFATGELRAAIEPGVEHDLGRLVLQPRGAVRGTARTESGERPGKLLLNLGPVELPEDRDALARFGPDETSDSSRSRPNGSFEFLGVPPGEYRVYTSPIGGNACTWSEPFEVIAGQATEAIELIATPDASQNAELLVLGADGEPLTTAWVRVETGAASISGLVNDEGLKRWGTTYPTWAGGTAFISDQSLRHQRTEVKLPMEAQRLTVRLELATTVERELHVVDPDGAALPAFTLQIHGENGTRTWRDIPSGSPLTVPAGSQGTFDVHVNARGFAPYAAEGLVGADLPQDWTLTLEPLPGIHGIVQSDGEAIQDATVEVRWKLKDGKVFSKGNNVSALVNATGDETTTDAAGRFHLHQEEDGDVVLIAKAAGFADALVELSDFDAAAGTGEVVLELEAGGLVRGTVFDHGAAPIAGAAVILDHPFHQMRRAHAGRDGSFEFRGVPAGDWYLRSVKEFDSGWMGWTVDLPEGWTYPTNVRVESNAELVHDIWLADPEGSSISGNLLISGTELPGLTAHVSEAGGGAFGSDPFAESWDDKTAVERDGSFGFLVAPNRSYTLGITAPGLGNRVYREVSAEELPLHLEEELAFAEISGEFASWEAEGGGMTLYVRWESNGWFFHRRVQPGDDGRFAPTLVPAGTIQLTWTTRGHGKPQSMELELTPGETRELELK